MGAIPFSKHEFRAAVHLRRFMHRHSHVIELAENCRVEENAVGHHWPLWCYLPMAVWLTLLDQEATLQASKTKAGKPTGSSSQAINEVARAATLGAWHATQGVYRFDPTLYEALISTPFNKNLLVDLFYGLPQWCTYIETPGLKLFDTGLKGIWAHLEHDLTTGAPELRLLLDTDSSLTIVPIVLGNWTFKQAMSRLLTRQSESQPVSVPNQIGQPQALDLLHEAIVPLLSLILYLCHYGAEITAVQDSDIKNPTTTADFEKRAVSSAEGIHPTLWLVGEKPGAKLRAHYHARELRHVTPAEKSETARQAHWRIVKATTQDTTSAVSLRWVASASGS